MTDLLYELRSAAGRVRQPHLDRLKALGVPMRALAHCPTYGFGVVNAEDVGQGLYQPCDHGDTHLVLPVLFEGCLVDLVAFRAADPGGWLLRTGHGWCLGLNEPVGLLTWRDSISLRATPIDWMRADQDGLCILDWSAVEQIHGLDVLPHIACDDHATADNLRRALTRPVRLPTISVMGGTSLAA
jgi:hypothetical protein